MLNFEAIVGVLVGVSSSSRDAFQISNTSDLDSNINCAALVLQSGKSQLLYKHVFLRVQSSEQAVKRSWVEDG